MFIVRHVLQIYLFCITILFIRIVDTNKQYSNYIAIDHNLLSGTKHILLIVTVCNDNHEK